MTDSRLMYHIYRRASLTHTSYQSLLTCHAGVRGAVFHLPTAALERMTKPASGEMSPASSPTITMAPMLSETAERKPEETAQKPSVLNLKPKPPSEKTYPRRHMVRHTIPSTSLPVAMSPCEKTVVTAKADVGGRPLASNWNTSHGLLLIQHRHRCAHRTKKHSSSTWWARWATTREPRCAFCL